MLKLRKGNTRLLKISKLKNIPPFFLFAGVILKMYIYENFDKFIVTLLYMSQTVERLGQ